MVNNVISVIVPVYNVKDYLDDCIKSILSQTYSNFELLLIDDGSTDGSDELCDEYEKKDNRIIVIHKENAGLSDARNVGLAHASGDYVTFIDSDDVVSKNLLAELHNAMLTHSCDIVQCNHCTQLDLLDTNQGSFELFDSDKALELFFVRKKIYMAAWAKLYRKNLFENKISFPVNKYYEDNFTTYKLIHNADKICHITNTLYWHRKRPNSITTSPFDEKYFDLMTLGDDIKNYFGNDYSKYKEACDYYVFRSLMFVYNHLITSKMEKSYGKEFAILNKLIKSAPVTKYHTRRERTTKKLISTVPSIYKLYLNTKFKLQKRNYPDGN